MEIQFCWISAASDGTVWGIDNSNTAFRYQQTTRSWQKMPQPCSEGLSQLSVGSAIHVWGVDAMGKIYRYGDDETGWQEIPGTMKGVSAAADGTICGIDSAGTVYRYVSEEPIWQPMTGKLAQLSVGSAEHIWGIDASGNIFRYEGTSLEWHKIPGQFASISVGTDGSVLGIDHLGNTLLYTGEPNTWSKTTFVVKQISAGNFSFIWGIDYNDHAVELTENRIREGLIHWLPTDYSVNLLEGHEKSQLDWGTRFWEIDENARFDDRKNTHLWIVIRATKIAVQAPIVGQLIQQFIKPEAREIPDATFHNALYQGLYDADYKNEYNDNGKWVSHFYDPSTHYNAAGQLRPSALTRAKDYFEQARDAYLENNLQEAGYNLGLSLHYMTDLTQPMHASNFDQIFSYPIGFHLDWEVYAQTLLGQVQPPTVYIDNDIGITPDNYLTNAAWHANDFFHNRSDLFKSFPRASPPSNWKEITDREITTILGYAVQITSQYLVAWFRSLPASLLWRRWFSIKGNGIPSGTPVTAIWRSASHLDLFVSESDNRVWNYYWEQETKWVFFSPIGVVDIAPPGAPVAALWRDSNYLDAFVTNQDGFVMGTFLEMTPHGQHQSRWDPWKFIRLQDNVKFKPSAPITLVRSPGNPILHSLYVTGEDGNVWSTFWNGTEWQSWFRVHPQKDVKFQPGTPVAALWRPGTLNCDLFVTGIDGNIWNTAWEPNIEWKPWVSIRSLEDNVKAKPGTPVTVVQNPNNALLHSLYVTGIDGNIWSIFWNGTGWQTWFKIHPEGNVNALPGTPVTALWLPDTSVLHCDLFVTGGDGTIWSTFWENEWQPWYRIHPEGKVNALPGTPVTALWRPDKSHLDLFVTGGDGTIWSIWGEPRRS